MIIYKIGHHRPNGPTIIYCVHGVDSTISIAVSVVALFWCNLWSGWSWLGLIEFWVK
jgi:hypothetical protein